MTALIVLFAALLVGAGVGAVYRRRSGALRAVAPEATTARREELLTAAGVDGSAPVVLHFSADWCGPCAAVRRVVGQVVSAGSGPVEIELNLDENPELAMELGVLSLPTTFIFDTSGAERFRISGVPSASDLRSALATLSVRS